MPARDDSKPCLFKGENEGTGRVPFPPVFVFVAFCEMDWISAAVSRFPVFTVSQVLSLSASSVTSCKMLLF
jgi:hypothetical protein